MGYGVNGVCEDRRGHALFQGMDGDHRFLIITLRFIDIGPVMDRVLVDGGGLRGLQQFRLDAVGESVNVGFPGA